MHSTSSAPKLKLVQLLSAGYDRVDIEAARRAGVPVCNNGGANAIAVAEHAILLMLAVCRRLTWLHEMVKSGSWRGNDVASVRLYELHGRTLGIIGLGNIGKKVARLAQGFGMAVQYFDVARLSEDAADTLGVKFRLFNEVLRTSDIVSLHVPLIPSTKHMMGAAQFRLMKPTAYLINTCRGPVVDEPALHEALTNGTIAGAGLDVFDQEPPPANNPLFTLDNVILTPHYAGPTWDNQSARFRNGFDNVQRVARGEKPLVGYSGAAGVDGEVHPLTRHPRGKRGMTTKRLTCPATPGSRGRILQERPRRLDAEHDLPHRLEVRGARLDLLRQRVDVAEPPLERGAEEDRVHAGRLVGIVRHRLGRLDRKRAGQPHARSRRHVDHPRIRRPTRCPTESRPDRHVPHPAAPPSVRRSTAPPHCRQAGQSCVASCAPPDP